MMNAGLGKQLKQLRGGMARWEQAGEVKVFCSHTVLAMKFMLAQYLLGYSFAIHATTPHAQILSICSWGLTRITPQT